MDGIFMCYLEGAEREAYIEEARFENEISKLNTLYEMCELKEDQMIRDIELKVLTESGTMDDYEFLLMEADAEVGAEKAGIISKIISAISAICKSIKDAIKNAFGKGNPNDEVEVPDTINKISEFANPINAIKTGVDKIKAGDYSGIANLVSGITVPAVAAGGAAAAVTKIKKKRSEVEGSLNQASSLVDTINNAINALNEKINIEEGKAENKGNQNTAFGLLLKGAKQVLNAAKNLSSNLRLIINQLTAAIGGAVETVKDKAGEAVNNVKNAVKGAGGEATNGDTVDVKTKGVTYYIYKKNGAVTATDASGKAIAVDINNLPKKVENQRRKIVAANEEAKRAEADPNAAKKQEIKDRTNQIRDRKATKAQQAQQQQAAQDPNAQQNNNNAQPQNGQPTQNQNNGDQQQNANNNQQNQQQNNQDPNAQPQQNNGNIFQRAANGAKNFGKKIFKKNNQQTAQEAEELEEIRYDLGEDYTVEMVIDEDGDEAYAITESTTIDDERFESIFGYKPEVEEAFSESEDDELREEEVADIMDVINSL